MVRTLRRYGRLAPNLAAAAFALACALDLRPAHGQTSPYAGVYARLHAARATNDAATVLAASRALLREASSHHDVDAAYALGTAADMLAGLGSDTDALRAIRMLSRIPLPADPLYRGQIELVQARAYALAAGIFERRGALHDAMTWAERAIAVDADGFGRVAALDALRTLARAAYARGDRRRARPAMLRVVRESSFDADVRFQVIAAAIAADDFDMVRVAIAEMERPIRQTEGDQRLALARARLMLASALLARNELTAATQQILAAHAMEREPSVPVLVRAASVVLRRDFDQFERALDFTSIPLRCDGHGRVVASAVQSLEARLAEVTGVRRRIEVYDVAELTVRARLREAAIHEAAATAIEIAPGHCLAAQDETQLRASDARAASLERAASRIEAANPRRADALRVEALLLRARASSGEHDAPADGGQMAALALQQRTQSVEAIDAAVVTASRESGNAPRHRAPDLSDPQARPSMARFIARAVERWRSGM